MIHSSTYARSTSSTKSAAVSAYTSIQSSSFPTKLTRPLGPSTPSSPWFCSSAMRSLFLFPTIRSVAFLSWSVSVSQFAILFAVPSFCMTRGPISANAVRSPSLSLCTEESAELVEAASGSASTASRCLSLCVFAVARTLVIAKLTAHRHSRRRMLEAERMAMRRRM